MRPIRIENSAAPWWHKFGKVGKTTQHLLFHSLKSGLMHPVTYVITYIITIALS